MKLLSFKDKNSEPCIFALGFFDGVHLGHRAVIKRAAAEAKARGVLSAVFTFTDSKNVGKKTQRGEIYPLSRRLEIFENLGVDFVLMPDFSDFCSLSPNEFVLSLCLNFSAVGFVCGEDFHFGKMAAGDTDMLSRLSKHRGADTLVLGEVMLENFKVSSTKIRETLKEGKIELANKMLGEPYSIKAEVVGGKHIGTKSLYPTINQPIEQNIAPLKFGVYASRSIFENKSYPSVTNIGVCPTVTDSQRPTIETYIIDQNINLYGKTVKVELISFLREEKKFTCVAELKEQIDCDIKKALKIGGQTE